MESENKNILFVLGAGASIASANSVLSDTLGILSMDNFIEVMIKMREENGFGSKESKELMDREFNFRECGDIFINDSRLVGIIKSLSKRYNERSISKLYDILKDSTRLNNSKSKKLREKDSAAINARISPLSMSDFIDNIYTTVSAYYYCFERRYFRKLYDIISSTKSPVISLNWDINFERVVFEQTGISMQNYYGETVFAHLKKSEKSLRRNPIVEILKPHGSLNQHFFGGIEHAYIGNLEKSRYHLYVSDCINPLNNSYNGHFIIPPINEEDIPLLDETNVRNRFRTYAEREVELYKGIISEIKKIVTKTDTLITIGYSFPKEDHHILELFKDNRIERIVVFDIDKKVFDRVRSFFPKAKYTEFKEQGFKDILEFEI